MNFDELKNKAEGLKDKAEDLAAEHKEQVEGGIDKAADLLGNKIGHDDQIDKAAARLKGLIPDDGGN